DRTWAILPILVLSSAPPVDAIAPDVLGADGEGLDSLRDGWRISRAFEAERGLDEGTARPDASLATLPLAVLSPASAAVDLFGEHGYAKVKIGPLFFINDFAGMNPGYEIDGAVGFHLITILGVEASSGYLHGDESRRELWGVPIEGRAIVEIPIIPLNPY